MCRRLIAASLCGLLIAGCTSSAAPPAKKPQPAAEKKPKSIIGQTTQDIGKYDPAAGLEIVEPDVEITNPITGPLEAYGPMVQQVSSSSVEYTLMLYNAEHGHFPSYDEFMTEIVKNKQGQLRLPVLPGKLKYQYDEENHKLVVVKPPDADADQ